MIGLNDLAARYCELYDPSIDPSAIVEGIAEIMIVALPEQKTGYLIKLVGGGWWIFLGEMRTNFTVTADANP